MKGKTAKIMMLSVMAGLLVFTSACSSTKDNGNETATTSPTGNDVKATATTESSPDKPVEIKYDPLGKIDPPIEVTAIRTVDPNMKFENGDTIEKNPWIKLYEDEFGIKLKYMWVSDPSQFAQKFNVTMTSGKLPDIMPVNGIQFKQLADAGQLADLTDALENYGTPESKDLLKKDGGTALNSATYGGKLLGLPVNPGTIDTAPLLWVRTDWLKKLNLPEPKTMEDVFKIAEAFVTQDPDGNKKKDTYGLGVAKELYTNSVLGVGVGLNGFFDGYHAYPQNWVTDKSGKLGYGSIQPEMKQALQKLQSMYKDGLIDAEFGVKDSQKIIQSVNAGKIGMLYGALYLPLVFGDGRKLDPAMDWKPYPILSIDDQPGKPQTQFSIDQYFVVRKGMEHPEAVVKMFNAFHQKWDPIKHPLTEISQNGDIAKWQYALVTGANPTQNVDAYARVKDALEKKDESLLDPKAPGQPIIYKAITSFNNGDPEGWGYTRVFGPDSALALLYDYNKNKGFQDTEFISGPTPTMVEKGATLTKLELETFTKIVMGEVSIDAFDEYVSNWKKLGGDKITEEVAQWKASK